MRDVLRNGALLKAGEFPKHPNGSLFVCLVRKLWAIVPPKAALFSI